MIGTDECLEPNRSIESACFGHDLGFSASVYVRIVSDVSVLSSLCMCFVCFFLHFRFSSGRQKWEIDELRFPLSLLSLAQRNQSSFEQHCEMSQPSLVRQRPVHTSFVFTARRVEVQGRVVVWSAADRGNVLPNGTAPE